MNYDPILLQEIDIKLPKVMACQLTSYKPKGKALKKFQQAAESFLEILPTGKEGKKLVRAIYEVHDRLLFDYYAKNQIACRKGCDICCRQLVCCSALETEVIIDFITNSGMEKAKIIYQVKKKSLKFFKEHEKIISTANDWSQIGDYLRKHAHGVTPCPYLHTKEKKCIIYPARPLICRVARTKNPCGQADQLKALPHGINLYVDHIAFTLIDREEKKLYGQMRVYPMAGWPITKPYGEFFL
ncbi:MAG: hypothetical protein Q7T79_01650 [bacterium]|nr:hypothetical protein [bacterium]